MRRLALTAILLAALTPAAALAYNGHDDPAFAKHHYTSMTAGCDIGMNRGVAHDSDGKPQPYMLLSAVGSCNDQDKATVDTCARALPVEFDDPSEDWGDVMACPLGSDIDTASGQQFWQTVYRAYGLFTQGIAADEITQGDTNA